MLRKTTLTHTESQSFCFQVKFPNHNLEPFTTLPPLLRLLPTLMQLLLPLPLLPQLLRPTLRNLLPLLINRRQPLRIPRTKLTSPKHLQVTKLPFLQALLLRSFRVALRLSLSSSLGRSSFLAVRALLAERSGQRAHERGLRFAVFEVDGEVP
jgi:hypothetical protein